MRVKYSPADKAEITAKLKAAAVALAEFWDVLAQVENAHGVSLECTPELVSGVASECNTPPAFSDLADREVWASFKADVKVSR